MTTDWEELLETLKDKKWLSTYNLLKKKRFKKVQFFNHADYYGQEGDDRISICLDGVQHWEIFLNKNGTWTLE